jgi:hypothetical protein
MAVVLLVHLGLAGGLLPPPPGPGSGDPGPRRIEVAFVRELAPSPPPPPPPVSRAHPPPRLSAALLPALPASATGAAAQPAPPTEPLQAVAALEVLPPAEPLAQAAPLPPLAEPGADPAPRPYLEWPPSTRLSYRLSGQARGPVHGQARVEWLRSGSHYQVMMEATVGPAFAPLYTRRDSSDGEITALGLSPHRYDLETRRALGAPARQTVMLESDRIRLPGGRELLRPEGVQDAVSQFVQLTWLFTTRPQLLQPGQTLELPLALPRQVEPVSYEVLGAETLDSIAGTGPLEAVHLRPQRAARGGGDFSVELWVAPSLQYLPVRLLIRQDAETYIDLLLERLPEQARDGR